MNINNKGVVVYFFKNNLYINLTNKCLVKCSYCIKYKWNFNFYGYNLKLEKEPTESEIKEKIVANLKKYPQVKEVVFCGYGDPLLRWKVVAEISRWLKENYPHLQIRINTNGLAIAYYKKDILKNFKGAVDVIYVSLNAHDEKTFNLLHKTSIKHPFKKILSFIRKAKKYIPTVVVTVIEHPQINLSKVKQIAKKLGVKLLTREYY